MENEEYMGENSQWYPELVTGEEKALEKFTHRKTEYLELLHEAL